MQLKKLSLSPIFLIQIATALFSAVIIVAAILYVVYQNIELKKQLNTIKSSDTTTQNQEIGTEVTSLLQAIGTVIDLPKNESPTVATILDPEPLRTNPFFTQARAGDKVIVYKTAGKAYLYRPETKKVIETGSFLPENIGTASSLGVEEQGSFNLLDTTTPSPTSSTSSSSTRPTLLPQR